MGALRRAAGSSHRPRPLRRVGTRRDGPRASGLHRRARRRGGRAGTAGGIDTLRGAERRFPVMTKLHELAAAGTSPWLDNIRRGWLKSGEFKRMVDDGVLGVTSNPTIFQKAIADSTDYDDAIA